MSAENWAICPVCKAKNDKANAKRILDAEKKYGKIPSEDYIALAKEVSTPIEIEETLREDYGIGVDEVGVFYVDYECRCEKCGSRYTFKHAEPAARSKPARKVKGKCESD